MSCVRRAVSVAWTSSSLNWSKARCVYRLVCGHWHHIHSIFRHHMCPRLSLLQEFLLKAEAYSMQADLLLGKAADIQLGAHNETLLQEAQSTREAVTQLQDRLNEQYDLFQLLWSSRKKKYTLCFQSKHSSSGWHSYSAPHFALMCSIKLSWEYTCHILHGALTVLAALSRWRGCVCGGSISAVNQKPSLCGSMKKRKSWRRSATSRPQSPWTNTWTPWRWDPCHTSHIDKILFFLTLNRQSCDQCTQCNL